VVVVQAVATVVLLEVIQFSLQSLHQVVVLVEHQMQALLEQVAQVAVAVDMQAVTQVQAVAFHHQHKARLVVMVRRATRLVFVVAVVVAVAVVLSVVMRLADITATQVEMDCHQA
jgi:hypothetical protein